MMRQETPNAAEVISVALPEKALMLYILSASPYLFKLILNCLLKADVHLSFQGLLVAILYCFVNKEVQSEMLKKWKRWKLGKDIDEEYRHTHSQTPHIKSGSIATGNLPDLQDNTSDPSNDSPRIKKAAGQRSCSAVPEENRRLVVSYSNGTGKCRSAKSRQTLQFTIPHQRGTTSRTSTTIQDICLEERVQYRSYPQEGDKTCV
ncbi:hypothetical protein ATANTOWER_029002 [Ataeniobius toweri]|uniref:Uncharacterized protein n=1 Tax=Ataeniobius toweri TaxID=208326 RepID=A0ABU7ASD0_9TELE|nr:hypothetical protein [Ataeniobius toweri]